MYQTKLPEPLVRTDSPFEVIDELAIFDLV